MKGSVDKGFGRANLNGCCTPNMRRLATSNYILATIPEAGQNEEVQDEGVRG